MRQQQCAEVCHSLQLTRVRAQNVLLSERVTVVTGHALQESLYDAMQRKGDAEPEAPVLDLGQSIFDTTAPLLDDLFAQEPTRSHQPGKYGAGRSLQPAMSAAARHSSALTSDSDAQAAAHEGDAEPAPNEAASTALPPAHSQIATQIATQPATQPASQRLLGTLTRSIGLFGHVPRALRHILWPEGLPPSIPDSSTSTAASGASLGDEGRDLPRNLLLAVALQRALATVPADEQPALLEELKRVQALPGCKLTGNQDLAISRATARASVCGHVQCHCTHLATA
jgi:hypothetical protein